MLKTNQTAPGATRSTAPRRTLAVALLAAVATFGAVAQPVPPGPDGGAPGMRMERGGMGMRRPGMEGMHPGMGGAGMGMFMMERRVERMLDAVGASDAQRTQIRSITQAAAADMRTQMDAVRALRAQGLQIFAAPSVDAAAAESLRQRMLAQHDQTSRRMLQAMLDVANVLTPEQRMTLARRAEQMRSRMRERMQQRDRAPRTPPGNS